MTVAVRASVRRMVVLAVTLVSGIVLGSCNESPEPEGFGVAAPVARSAGGTLVYDHVVGFCEDTDEAGVPYPGAPARPLWTDFEELHYDGQGSRIPSYRNPSENLNVLESLQFLLSTISNLTGAVEDAQQFLSSDNAVEAIGGALVPQVEGNCVCITGGCTPDTVMDEVDDAVQQLVATENISWFLESYLNDKVNATIADLEGLLDYIESLGDPSGPFFTTLSMELTAAMTGAVTDADGQLVAGVVACTDALGDGTMQAAVQAAVDANVAALQADLLADLATLQSTLNLAVGLPTSVLNQLATDLATVTAFFDGVSGIGDIISMDWAALGQTINDMIPYYEGVVTDVQAAITDVQAVIDNVTNFDATIDQLVQDIINDVAAAGGDVSACMDALDDVSQWSLGSPQDFIDALTTAFTNSVEIQWQDLLDEVDAVWQALLDRINGIGLEDALSFYVDEVGDIQGILSSVQTNCYLFGTRNECYDHCNASSSSDFLWLPVDFLQDPAATTAGVASAGLFALDQIGWLDQVQEWVSTQMETELGAAFSSVLSTLGGIADTIQAILDFLGEALAYIDLFSEGYHLGAYSDLRPDLHQCIPWAGHGAYAQFGSLGGDNFSIGARYGAHQLSEKRRVQVRTGGFGVSAYGHQLTLVPNLSLSLQLDGWKLWNAAAPFGIPAATTVSQEAIETIDVFNVVAWDDFPLVDGQPVGAFLVRDLFPSRTSPSPADQEWPRIGVDAPWESRSIAVATFGLNLELDYPADGPGIVELPSVPVIPGILTATPSFTYRVGASWTHQTDLMRDRVQEMINANLPASAQLDADDFARDMHAMQGPDLTDDNRVAAYVEPGIGIDAFLGFKLWKIRIGAGAFVNLSVNIEAGGTGGVVDLNAALAEAMLNANPPQDAPCDAVWEFQSDFSCSNVDFPESGGAYACETDEARGSCCLQIIVQRDDEPLNYGACVDAWTGIDQNTCKQIEFTNATVEEAEQQIMNIPPWLGSLRTQLLNLLDQASAVTITNTWRATASCAEEPCGFDGSPEFVLDTGVAAVSALTECDQFGFCTIGDEIVHDVALEECEGDGSADGLGGIWTPYACRELTEAELVGWEGDGCHPMQQGFPSACGCVTDGDCVGLETCVEGQCTTGDASFSCVCDDAGDCPAGRVCVDGGCATPCGSDTDCAAGRVCDAGACAPPHGVPTAESIVWGMANIGAPAHLISSYAMSDLLATLMLTLDLYVEASFKLFGKERKWRILDLHRGWDLGSTWKGWYQPGLEAIYHDECSEPTLSSPVTNRYPQSTTLNPFGSGTDIGGVSPNSLCINGGVCRYPDNLPASEASPEDYVLGNAGTVSEFLDWCYDEVPQHVEDPDPSTNEGIVQSAADTLQFSQDVALTVYANNPICIDGVPWDQWMAGIEPTIDADGNVVDEGLLGDYDCRYDDPVTGDSYVFPCADINAQMMAIWGCLDTDANAWSAQLAASFPSLVIPDPTFGTILDIDAMFSPTVTADPVFGLGEELAYTLDAMFPQYRFLNVFPYANIGQFWLITVDACVDTHFNDPAEYACECEVDADCVEGERCGPAGVCEYATTFDVNGECLQPDCAPVWEASECSIVSLQADVGLCCGDGIVQEGEECDDGLEGSDSCTPECTVVDTGRPAACCLGSGVCAEPIDPTECRELGGQAYVATTCEALDYCGDGSPVDDEPLGACCTGIMCLEAIPRAECAELGTWYEDTPCSEIPNCPARGACCTDIGCFDVSASFECPSTAVFSEGQACSEVDCGEPPTPLGACCTRDGCTDAVTEVSCEAREGTWFEDIACEPRLCDVVAPLGACCERDGSCTDGLDERSCSDRGGAFSAGTSCDEVSCREPLGACCLGDGRCLEAVSQRECEAERGTFSLGASCAEVNCGVPCERDPRYGTRCSECGIWACDDDGVLFCDEQGNACGGCRPLRAEPGTECGDCGRWTCRSEDEVFCLEPIGGCNDVKTGACCGARGGCTDGVDARVCDEGGGRWYDGACSDVGRFCRSRCPYPDLRAEVRVEGSSARACGLSKTIELAGFSVRCGTIDIDNPYASAIESAVLEIEMSALSSGTVAGGFTSWLGTRPEVATVEVQTISTGASRVPFVITSTLVPSTYEVSAEGLCPER